MPDNAVPGNDVAALAALPDPDEYFEHVLQYAGPGGVWTPPGPAARWQASWRAVAQELTVTDPGLADFASRHGFVATTEQLARLGIERRVVRRHLRRGVWWSPCRGTVALCELGDDGFDARRRRHATSAAAAASINAHSVVGHRSAAILHGLPTLAVPDRCELIDALPRSTHTHRPSALARDDVTSWFGVDVSTAARTVVDLARADRRDGLMAADAALRESLVSTAGLDAVLATERGWPGVRQAREVLALASPLAESALESVTRLAVHDSGLPAPRLQFPIRVPGRDIPYRVDLCWPARRLVLECDGRVKYTIRDGDERDGDPLWREKRRETRLRRAGWRVERVTWDDVLRFWPETVILLRERLAG